MKRSDEVWRTPPRRVGRVLARLFVRRFPHEFGVYELLAIGSVEWMRRHLAILNELERIRRRHDLDKLGVLDFGGAEGALGRAVDLYGLSSRFDVTVVDVDEEAVARTPIRRPIIAASVIEPNSPLPFADCAFDVVVSSDVFEHIPAVARAACAAEARRVSRLAQIHTIPIDSADGRWQSTATDKAFSAWQRSLGAAPDRWTEEHLAIRAPTLEEIQLLFPGARIEPLASASIWLHSMRAQRGPKGVLTRVRFAVGYLIARQADARKPPYKNAIVVA
jgi:Methyltransferase domain